MCERMSMGSGKTIVEFFSADIVLRVCKGERRGRERVRRGQEGGRALDTFAPEGRGWKGSFTLQTDEERVTELTHIT